MKREMTFEELPPNSWQRDAFEKGFIFYGEPSNPKALKELSEKIENNQSKLVDSHDQQRNIDSIVGKVAVAEQINGEFDPCSQDRYAHFIAT